MHKVKEFYLELGWFEIRNIWNSAKNRKVWFWSDWKQFQMLYENDFWCLLNLAKRKIKSLFFLSILKFEKNQILVFQLFKDTIRKSHKILHFIFANFEKLKQKKKDSMFANFKKLKKTWISFFCKCKKVKNKDFMFHKSQKARKQGFNVLQTLKAKRTWISFFAICKKLKNWNFIFSKLSKN